MREKDGEVNNTTTTATSAVGRFSLRALLAATRSPGAAKNEFARTGDRPPALRTYNNNNNNTRASPGGVRGVTKWTRRRDTVVCKSVGGGGRRAIMADDKSSRAAGP